MRYAIVTFGCRVNQADSLRIEEDLLRRGAAEAPASQADLVVVNTCSVREKAEDKLYSRLGEIRQSAAEAGRSPTIAVAGCVAQQEGEALLKRGASIDVVVGTQSLKQLPQLVARAALVPSIVSSMTSTVRSASRACCETATARACWSSDALLLARA